MNSIFCNVKKAQKHGLIFCKLNKAQKARIQWFVKRKKLKHEFSLR
eukprot:UN12828